MMALHLAIAALLFLTATAAGKLVLARTGFNFYSKDEELAFSAATGFAGLSVFAMITGFAGLIYRPIFAAALAGIIIISRRQVLDITRYLFSGAAALVRNIKTPGYSPFEKLLAGIMLLAALFNLIFAYAPPTDTDSLLYHLGIPKLFIDYHRIIHLPENFLSYMPLSGEMIYTWGLILGGGLTAKLVSYLFTIMFPGMLLIFTRQYFGRRTALLAGAAFYLSLPAINAAGVANVDIMYAFFAFAAFWSIMKWIETHNQRWCLLSAVMAAISFTTKLSNAPLIICLAVTAILYVMRNKMPARLALNVILAFMVIPALIALPWFVRNFIHTGNPFPFFDIAAFGMKLHPMTAISGSYYSKPVGFGISATALSFFQIFLGNPVTAAGPTIIVFALPLIFLRNVDKKILFIAIFATAILATVFLILPYDKTCARYHFLAIALLYIVAAYGFERLSALLDARRILAAIFLAPLIFPGLAFSAYFGAKRIPLLTGLQSPGQYILSEYEWGNAEDLKMIDYLNKNVSRKSRVMFPGYFFVDPYYYSMRVVVAQPELLALSDINEVLNRLRNDKIDYIVMRKYYYTPSENGSYYENNYSSRLDMRWEIEDYVPAYFEKEHVEGAVTLYKIK